jgi:hypothetical protein
VALIEYLRAEPLPLPIEVADTQAEEGLGTLTPGFERGDLFLTSADGTALRLSWTGAEGEERTRALPAGEYVLKTYRIVRTKGDELWHISATSPSIQRLKVKAGANLAVEVDETIRLRAKLGSQRAQMTIQGQNGAGLTIYRDGKRIPIDYRVVDDAGEVVASGRMRYG